MCVGEGQIPAGVGEIVKKATGHSGLVVQVPPSCAIAFEGENFFF